MEADWERREPHQPLDLEGARTLLAPIGFEVRALSLIPEGRVNTNFRVETATGPVLLRLHHGADHVVDIEAALAERLSGVVPLPRLWARGARFLVYEWLPGISLERALAERLPLPYQKIARDLAAVRLGLNCVTFPAYGFFASDLTVPSAWPSAVASFFGYVRLLLEPPTRDHAFAARVEATLDRAEPRLKALEGPPLLVHGDFKPTNVLVDERGLTGVVDWEFAHAGTRLADVAQILRHPETLPSGFTSAFADTLGLDADTLLLAGTLDLANLVDLRYKALESPRALRDLERRIYEVCDLYEARFGG